MEASIKSGFKTFTTFTAGSLTLLVVLMAPGCGGTGTGNPGSDNVALQSAPLAGPNAASIERGPLKLAYLGGQLVNTMLGIADAFATTVSSFTTFRACNDTMIFKDINGNQLNINGSSNPSVGRGLLTFSPTSTTAMSIGTISIPAGTVLSEIDITFAVVPDVCQGATYAVEFESGSSGVRDITQNTAFKFLFPTGGTTISASAQTITLKLGDIVNGMVSKGASLDNSTIQTVNVGQAQ